jgi:DNA polymerase-3 subunit epsilon
MNLILSFDTETTGIPDWKIPSEDPSQPHLLKIGAQLVDIDTRAVVEELSVLVRPDDWVVSAEITEITGITLEMAMELGIPEAEALDRLMAMYDKCQLRTAFNTTFDNRIVRIPLEGYYVAMYSGDLAQRQQAAMAAAVAIGEQMGVSDEG